MVFNQSLGSDLSQGVYEYHIQSYGYIYIAVRSLLEIFEYWSNYYNTCIKFKIMADVMFRAIFRLEMAQEIEKK